MLIYWKIVIYVRLEKYIINSYKISNGLNKLDIR